MAHHCGTDVPISSYKWSYKEVSFHYYYIFSICRQAVKLECANRNNFSTIVFNSDNSACKISS